MLPSSQKSFTVLVVEDDPDLADWMIDCLQNQTIPLNIHHAINGEMALQYLLQKGRFSSPQSSPRPHLILLDLHLPKYSGLEILKKIRSHSDLENIPVIILSGSQSDPDMQQAYRLHANSYLVKPIDSTEFEALLKLICQYWLLWNNVPTPQTGTNHAK